MDPLTLKPAADAARPSGPADPAAFERLYRETAPAVHSLARRILGSRHADEATQEAYLRAWRALPGFRGEGAAAGWMRRVALSVVLDRRRELLRRVDRAELPATDSQADPPAAARDGALALDLEAALAALPEGARTVFVLHDIEGHEHAEIAALLDVAVGTSKSQLHRARLLLRERLAGAWEDTHD